MCACDTRAQIRDYNVRFSCDTRAQIRDGTTLGLAAKSYIDKGDLVPDKVIVSIFELPCDRFKIQYLRIFLPGPDLFTVLSLLSDRLCLTLYRYLPQILLPHVCLTLKRARLHFTREFISRDLILEARK